MSKDVLLLLQNPKYTKQILKRKKYITRQLLLAFKFQLTCSDTTICSVLVFFASLCPTSQKYKYFNIVCIFNFFLFSLLQPTFFDLSDQHHFPAILLGFLQFMLSAISISKVMHLPVFFNWAFFIL